MAKDSAANAANARKPADGEKNRFMAPEYLKKVDGWLPSKFARVRSHPNLGRGNPAPSPYAGRGRKSMPQNARKPSRIASDSGCCHMKSTKPIIISSQV